MKLHHSRWLVIVGLVLSRGRATAGISPGGAENSAPHLECCEPCQVAGLQSGCLCRESKAAAHSRAWRRASAIASALMVSPSSRSAAAIVHRAFPA